jgi:hypothetical protein
MNSTTNEVNLTIKQGSDYRFLIIIKDKDGVPVDLGNKTFRGQCRKQYNSPDPEFSFLFTKADQTESPGQVEVHVPNDALDGESLFDKANYVYDIEMVETIEESEEVSTVIYGKAIIIPEVTR